jgi:hypothetical protein
MCPRKPGVRKTILVYKQAIQRAASTGDALLNTELGASDDISTRQRVVDEADASMMPWTAITAGLLALASASLARLSHRR